MANKKKWLWWGIILGIAILVRTYRLGEVPYGFHVDEIKAGWNAWSILQTGRDDRGNMLAGYYDSFGDYRPTGIFYTIIPALLLLGKSILAVRLVPALFGALTIWPLGLMIRELTHKNNERLVLTGMLLLALNPWHINVSRATSEGIICVFFCLWAVYFLMKIINKNQWRDVLGMGVFLVLSYGFATIRVLGPILIMASIGFFYYRIQINKSQIKIWAVVAGMLVLTIGVMVQREARGRLSQVSILNDAKLGIELQQMPVQEGPNRVLTARFFHNKVVVYGKKILNEYLNYFSSGFLVGDSAKPIRYSIPYFGLITYAEIIMLMVGLVAWGGKKEIGWWWLMLFLAPIPAAITIEDTPNMHRALFMVPFLVGVEAYGLEMIWKTRKWGKILTGIVLGGWILNLVYFGHMYFIHGQFGLASYFRDGGNVELAGEINKIQNNYDRIILSNYPDNLYPWIAFLNNKDPGSFNLSLKNNRLEESSFENLIFSDQHCPSEKLINHGLPAGKLLIVDAEGCQIDKIVRQKLGLNLIKTIRRPDNSPPYYLWEREVTVTE